MIDIRELGLMTFYQASKRWRKDLSYVQKMYSEQPENFLVGTVDCVGIDQKGRKVYVITRIGMEYLTGETEIEANKKGWVVYLEQDRRVIEEKLCNTEKEAISLVKSIAHDKSSNKHVELRYLDKQRTMNGTLLPAGILVYYMAKK